MAGCDECMYIHTESEREISMYVCISHINLTDFSYKITDFARVISK